MDVYLARILHKGGRTMISLYRVFNQLPQHNEIITVTFCPCGFMTNILSGAKYRVSPGGVGLMDETSNLASHLEDKTWTPIN